jgi:hypothetical protein
MKKKLTTPALENLFNLFVRETTQDVGRPLENEVAYKI